MTYLADFSVSDKSDMFDILSGSIEFYPGKKVQGQASIKAPNLQQTTQSSVFNTTQEVMDEMDADLRVQKDLWDIMKFIRLNNTPEQEA